MKAEKGFKVITADCTGFLCSIAHKVNAYLHDSDMDDFGNHFEYYNFTLKESFPEMDDLEIDIDGTCKLLRGEIMGISIDVEEITDNENTSFVYDEKIFTEFLSDILKCQIS